MCAANEDDYRYQPHRTAPISSTITPIHNYPKKLRIYLTNASPYWQVCCYFKGKTYKHGFTAISKKAMISGCFVAAWHLHESKRFFNELSQPESISDSLRLIRWMKEYFQLHGSEKVTFRDLQNRSPVREKSRLTNALQELQDTHHIKLKSSGKSKLIYLNPALLKGDDR